MTVPNRDEVRDFLTTRRAKVRPDQVEPAAGVNRRVPGLRRAEVAMLAGVSVEYYARLERGNLAGASDAVLDAIARALLLDDAERDHLFDLARAAEPAARTPTTAPSGSPACGPRLQYTLDAITGGPALVRNGRLDIIAANTLGRALYAPAYAGPRRPVNIARHAFLDREQRRGFYPDWDTRRRRRSSRSCAPRPAATPTTRTCRTSSVSCPPAATTFRAKLGRPRRASPRHRREALPPPRRRPARPDCSRAPTWQQTRDGSC